MYFVDREKIEGILVYLDGQIEQLMNLRELETPIEIAAAERFAHMIIESMLDIGNSMIDGFIMRDPGSYEDIVDILEDERVIPSEDAIILKGLILYRKKLIQDYTDVDTKMVVESFQSSQEVLESFSTHTRTYLTNELGPVSAFKN
ncbi:hypothetical protein Q75_12730 [Bacillus coahuilensis p1.1.43]|uniref:DUF86 domain-containing protein n=1 Tax=Bacillus coahuilensis p1.1.43 TaxID=1150625 RepID=A0A147K644_9BACI|nr:DUF86 domain-containing protein [Bacillus coahuilensis]KUP05295.1 hypothetical protein Q75_12730 [Bacillus coahuilensis p1.1.43]